MSDPPSAEPAAPISKGAHIWALAITGIGVFMVTLDNLVVTTALPVIRVDLDASITALGWVVNAYTLAFAVLLLTGAAMGDRFGRRRVFAAGLTIFALASMGCALAPNEETLIAFRALQGLGAAPVLPLSLTLLADAFPAGKRGLAIGIWSGISGLAVAGGPVVGGSVVDALSWHWIFWINVPIGLIGAALALTKLRESFGPDRGIDIPGVFLVGLGVFGVVFGIVRGNDAGWTSPGILTALIGGVLFLSAFIVWESRATSPMLPLGLFRNRGVNIANAASVCLYFGLFGAVFFLAQFLQTVQGDTPLMAGLKVLPWTVMPMFIAPLAGAMSDRIGPRPFMVSGLAIMSGAFLWLGLVIEPTISYWGLVGGFLLAGFGMSLVFAPVSNLLVLSVAEAQIGKASGANNTVREVGGALGIAVMTAIFTASGSYASGQAYVDGLNPAVLVGAAVLLAGAIVSLAAPRVAGHRPPGTAAH
jgi:EmrB/QacA subfamily drug resistance transporter